jgi:hypothetical protein
MRFPTSGYTYGAAGLVITAGDYDNGYYIELVRTKVISATDRVKWTNELCFYVKYNNGTIRRIGPNGGKGIPMEVIAGKWYDLDVHFEWQGTDRVVSIMVNGVTRMTAVVPVGIGTGESIGGRYGFFTRGFSSAEFEYLYSSTYPFVDSTFDQEGWFDRISGGYQSGQYDREWTYGLRTNTKLNYGKKPARVVARYNSRLMDEFGPVVHEVREFDVKFNDKAPVLNSYLYFSNDNQIICPQYTGTPFGAKFILANTARTNAVVNGEDTLNNGEPLEQKMLVYGRVIERKDEETVTVTDEASVNMRGVIEVDISSSWIQSKTAAEAIGKWITGHWGGGVDEVVVGTLGNPLLQIGDVVSINQPAKSMTHSTHKYFVVGINHKFSGSMTSSFTLRRLRL